MLSKKYFPIITAIIGFAAAWLLKPKGQDPVANSTEIVTHTTSSHSSGETRESSPDRRVVHNPLTHTADGKPLPPELVELRTNLANNLSNAMQVRDQGYVQRITELLALTPQQQQEFLALLQDKRKALNIYAPGSGINSQNILEQAEVIEKQFNDALGKLLSGEQIDTLNQFRAQQKQNRMMAQAQKEFADVLEKIDLNPNQQEAVITTLHDIESKRTSALDATGLFAETFDTMGFGSASGPMSETNAANASIAQATDKKQQIQQLIDDRRQQTQQKIERLRTILTPAQLAQYSALLEARDQTFYNSMAPHLSNAPEVPQEEK